MKTNSKVFGVAAVLITLLLSPALGWTGEEASRASSPRSSSNDKPVKRTLIIDGHKVQVYIGSRDARTDAEIVTALRSLDKFKNEVENESQLREHLNRIGVMRAEDVDGPSSAPEGIPHPAEHGYVTTPSEDSIYRWINRPDPPKGNLPQAEVPGRKLGASSQNSASSAGSSGGSDTSVNWGEQTTRVAEEDTKKSQAVSVDWGYEETHEVRQPSRSWNSEGSDTSVNWGEQTTRVTREDTGKSQDVSVDWGSETTREAGQTTRTTSASSSASYPTKFNDRIQWNDLQGNEGTRNVTPPGGFPNRPIYDPRTGTYIQDRWKPNPTQSNPVRPTPNRPNVGNLPVQPTRPPSTGTVKTNNTITDISGLRLPVRNIPFSPNAVRPTQPTRPNRHIDTGDATKRGDSAIIDRLLYNDRPMSPGVRPTKTGQPPNVKKGGPWGSDPYAPLNLQPNRTRTNIGHPTGTVKKTNIKAGVTQSNINRRPIPNNVNRARKGNVLR